MAEAGAVAEEVITLICGLVTVGREQGMCRSVQGSVYVCVRLGAPKRAGEGRAL